jgi:hypothetical protein
MSERFSENTSSDLRSEGRGLAQGQGQGQFNDPTTRDPDFTGPDIRNEGRVSAQGHGQEQFNDNPTTRTSHLGNRAGGDPFRDTSQSADPDFGRHDPTRGQFNEQTRTRGGQDYDQYGQQGQWRQGGQTTSDNTYLGGDREPHQTGYKGQVIGGPQERFEPPGNYGTSTGTGPGARPCDHEIRRDGGFGGKPTIPERVMGAAEKVVGKATGNVRMYEHGQERKAGGY